jgi:hypothetical protein
MDEQEKSLVINKKSKSLHRHERIVERLHNKESLTEFDRKKLSREKYMVRKIRKAIFEIENLI